MKKKLWVFTFLVLLIAVFLCACDNKNSQNPGGSDENPTVKWENMPTPSGQEIYTKFLSGATSVIKEFSRSELKTKPRISAESKLKLDINGNDFWATLKLNYNNLEKENSMLAFEITAQEDSYDDIILGFYLFQERVYVAIGKSKFSVNCKSSAWEKYFPFDYKETEMSKTAMVMAGLIINVEDKEPICKKRVSGTNTELKYTVFIDLPATATQLVNTLEAGTEILNIENIEQYDDLIKSLLGVSFEDIKSGKFPESELTLDFSLYNLKLANINLKLNISGIDNGGTLFEGDELDLTVNLQSFYTSKTQNVSIPFVNNDFAQERARYVYYLDNAFRVTLDTVKETAEDVNTPYLVDITAKVFQEDSLDNYAFIEYKEKTSGELDRAIYVYKNKAYLFNKIDSEFKCVLSMPFDLTDISYRTVINDFNGASQLDIIGAISYVIAAVKFSSEDIKFAYDSQFYYNLWFNFYDMLNFVNERFEENILEQEAIKDFIEFSTTLPSVISFRYDTAFLAVVPSNDNRLKSTIILIENAEPDIILTEKEALEGEVDKS